MSVIKELQPASFRGVGFLVNAETKTGGKKTVTHEFVNSDKRFTESLGKFPPKFTIEAVVNGDDAIQRRLNLERVLDLPGVGNLVHPIYGDGEVESTTYTTNSNQTRIGEFRFSINFETSEAITPAATQSKITTPESVSTAAKNTSGILSNVFEDNYVNPSSGFSENEAADQSDNLYETVLNAVANPVGAIQDKIADFTRFVSDARSDIFTIVSQGSILKQSLEDLFQAALDVVSTPEDLIDAWNDLTDYGFLDIQGDTNTKKTQEAESNKSILREYARLVALINLYEAYAHKDYQTDVELSDARNVLDAKYNELIEMFSDDIDVENVSVLTTDNDFRNSIASLRVTANGVFDEKEQNVWRVVTISPGKSSMALTAYRYYGSLDQLDLITGLSPSVNHANFNQDIMAVSR